LAVENNKELPDDVRHEGLMTIREVDSSEDEVVVVTQVSTNNDRKIVNSAQDAVYDDLEVGKDDLTEHVEERDPA
jgi:hypothetical protein